MALLYKPLDGWLADVIPFYWQDTYHLFYLKDYRDTANHGEGTPWFQLQTNDFVTFTEAGEAIARGSADEQDLYVFTGCVIEKDGRFHIFYTGHNPHLKADGKPMEAVMRASSADLQTWTKDADIPLLFADDQRYEVDDWRDPFVFWNAEANQYWMLLAARLRSGPSNRRGCVALAVSQDLETWEIREPFWAPSLYFTHECPDLFRIGDWWYLVYSTFSERTLTHYRMARSLVGPWLAPPNDSFDGRAFYAAKTASDGQRRFAFGWVPTRAEAIDTGPWQWGGNLAVHEVVQQADGALTVRAPLEILAQFNTPLDLDIEPQIGSWDISDRTLSNAHGDGFAYCKIGTPPERFRLDLKISYTSGTRGCGVMLKADDSLDHYYQVRVEPMNNRVVFDRWPRRGDEPFIIERPVALADAAAIQLQILMEDTILIVYINNQVALSARCYDHPTGACGVFMSEGAATFSEIQLSTTASQPS